MTRDILHGVPMGWLAAGLAVLLILLVLLMRGAGRRSRSPARPRFTDKVVNREHRYALGVDSQTGGYYLSIPVANHRVTYEEYYALSEAEFMTFQSDSAAAIRFAESCRRREQDARLILNPGEDRGTAG